MSVDFKSLDEFPTFTGEESPKEQIRQLQNYLYSMKESIRYLLSNLGSENMNPAAWLAMKQETIAGQTQEDAFNALTNNGKVQGFGVVNNQLYINAELVKVLNLIAEKLRTSSGGYTIRIQDGKITAVHDNEAGVDLIKMECHDIDFGDIFPGYKGYVGRVKLKSLVRRDDDTVTEVCMQLNPDYISFYDESGEQALSIGRTDKWEYVESIGKEVLTREAVNT